MADYSQVKVFLNKNANSAKVAIQQDEIEREITSVRASRIKKSAVKGNFDFEHLAKIHYQLFCGLYDHAGKLRQATENWGKQDEIDPSLYGEFAPVADAIEIIDNNSQFLLENNFLKDLDRDDFVYEFTVSYAEVNSAHPFVDGNGRATRLMFYQLAEQVGYEFCIDDINKNEWNRACLLSSKHFILYENDECNGYVGEEQEIDINPLLQIMDRALIKK